MAEVKTFTPPIVAIGNVVANSFKIELKRKDKIATRKTVDSITINTNKVGNSFEFNVFANKSFIFVQKGRGANKRQPPINPILEWIRARRITPTRGTQRGLAFAIAKRIGIRGIKPTDIIGGAEAIMKPKIATLLNVSFVSFMNNQIIASAK